MWHSTSVASNWVQSDIPVFFFCLAGQDTDSGLSAARRRYKTRFVGANAKKYWVHTTYFLGYPTNGQAKMRKATLYHSVRQTKNGERIAAPNTFKDGVPATLAIPHRAISKNISLGKTRANEPQAYLLFLTIRDGGFSLAVKLHVKRLQLRHETLVGVHDGPP